VVAPGSPGFILPAHDIDTARSSGKASPRGVALAPPRLKVWYSSNVKLAGAIGTLNSRPTSTASETSLRGQGGDAEVRWVKAAGKKMPASRHQKGLAPAQGAVTHGPCNNTSGSTAGLDPIVVNVSASAVWRI